MREQNTLITDEGRSLLDVVVDYTYALDTLDRYDYQQFTLGHTTSEVKFRATYENAMQTIRSLKNKFGGSRLSGMKRTVRLRVRLARFTKLSGEKTCILLLRKKRLCCCIW